MPKFQSIISSLILCALFFAGSARGDDLTAKVESAKQDHVPVNDERMGEVRAQLSSAAQALERRLGGDSPFAQNWKKYLKWDLLEPHFSSDVKITGTTLKEVDQVLRRFRKNVPGLEHPEFQKTARAIENYRELAFWYAFGLKRDSKKLYALNMSKLEKQLTRNLEKPTMESERMVGKLLGQMTDLGESLNLVEEIQGKFSKPNLYIEVSEDAVNHFARRPVREVEPVHDCILGAAVRGTALSTGSVSFRTLPSHDKVKMEVMLAGHITSNTTSYKKPVKVKSIGHTNFVATKNVMISDQKFTTTSALADAKTKTQTQSVRKTGGNFGRRIIEKIARKKVAESKPKAQRIAARHAEDKIKNKFNNQLLEIITGARAKYVRKLRPPLERIAMFPKYLLMNSDSDSVHVEATLANYKQISTDSVPPKLALSDDMKLQVHETAINNFFPTVLAGLKFTQEFDYEPPRIEGDVPAWMKKLSENPKLGEALDQDDAKNFDFRPWSMTLNDEHPASVSFNDQKLTLRVRIAELKTKDENDDESIQKNWDLLVSYKMILDGNSILLRREGEIQALPTGFDPEWFGDERWSDKLTGKQVGIRRNLENNLNKRAEAGAGIPKEIKIPELKIPAREGRPEETLVLQQFDCDDGWLTLGYKLP